MATSPSESAEHLRLKRLALVWAQAHGYAVAAPEVSVPDLGFRLDVAGYRPGRETLTRPGQRPRRMPQAAVGLTALFECKASRADCQRDSRSLSATRERLATLAAQKARQETLLRLHYPSIRNGDSLFPEYETLDFERPGYEAYQRTLTEMRHLGSRLHRGTKFDKLTSWRAANLHYLVAEPAILRPGELPIGWGLLTRDGDALEVVARPVFHDVEERQRLHLLHRIALAATRACNRNHGIASGDLDRARRGLPLAAPVDARDESAL